MPTLGDYSNVYNTALLVLHRKGFRLWYDGATDLYGAERDGWDFLAPSPTSLLGLMAIYEFQQPSGYREYWWRIDGPKLYGELSNQPPEFVSIQIRPGGRA